MSSTAPAAPPRRVSVFVGVDRDGSPDPQIGKIIRRRLERSGEVVRAPDPPLSREERACSSVDCLGPLAGLRHAKRLWGAAVQQVQGEGRPLRVWMYDAPTQRLFESEPRCSGCDDQALASAILEARSNLFEHLSINDHEPGPPAAPPSPSPSPISQFVTVPRSPPPAAPPSFWSTGRGRAATAIIPLLAVTLGASIVLSALHGSGEDACLVTPAGEGGVTTRCNSGLVLGLGYGASGLLAGGLLLTFILPGGK